MYMNRYPIVGMIDTSGKHVDTKYCTVVLSFTSVCCVFFHPLVVPQNNQSRGVVVARANERTHACTTVCMGWRA